MLLNVFKVRPKDKELNHAVRVALIEALYASRASLAIGALLGGAVAAVTSYYCRTTLIEVTGLLLTLCGALRVASFGFFRPGNLSAGAKKWEILYDIGAVSYAALLGLLTLEILLVSTDLRLHALMATLATGYAAGAAGRNTGRPFIAIGQLLSSALPISIGLLLTDRGPAGMLLAVANLLFIIVVTDITLLTYKTVLEAFIDRQEKLQLATVYEKLSKTDPLTGIDNRGTLRLTLERLLHGHEQAIAVLWLDLDRFKQINDTMGHAAGDDLLHHVASRLSKFATPMASVARFGGDEFIVVVPVENVEHAMKLAEMVREVIAKPVGSGQGMMDLTVSVGIAISSPGISSDDLLRHADVALYEAKAKGRNRVILFDPEMERRLVDRQHLEHDLKRAIAQEELDLHFQPIVNLSTKRVESFEALLRWHHPIHGNIPPSTFVPIAESIGIIDSLTAWVLRVACAEAQRWPDSISVAVNISAGLLKGRDLPTMVVEALMASGLSPRRLELEITESAIVEDNPNAAGLLDGFQKLGIRVSLDDFGTGYSSLSYLCRYKFDRIKIDRSFISSPDRQSETRAVVQAISSLAKSLDLSVIAEGIETTEQEDYVAGLGCAAGQGYLFARPMPREHIAGYLAGTPNGADAVSPRITPLRVVRSNA
ncbi:MAG: putative bifunctional diguanylate cyclase/phosphodiesterase [Sphingomonas oligoaromativorans]